MANLLYEEQSIADIASAIRAKDGDDTLMKVGDMATRIRSLGYGYSGVVSYSEAGTQPATDVGKLVLLTGENFTLTMPNVANLQPGVALTYFNDGNGTVTLSGTFENGDTSFVVQKGLSISVVWSGNSWAVIDTQATAVATEGTNFVRFTSGLTIQWGKNIAVTGQVWGARAITFPIAFTDDVYSCVATVQSAVQVGKLIVYTANFTLTGATITCALTDQDLVGFDARVQYIAIGK